MISFIILNKDSLWSPILYFYFKISLLKKYLPPWLYELQTSYKLGLALAGVEFYNWLGVSLPDSTNENTGAQLTVNIRWMSPEMCLSEIHS